MVFPTPVFLVFAVGTILSGVWLYRAHAGQSGTADVQKAPLEQERVRDQLKFVVPVFKRDFVQVGEKKYIEKAQLAIVLQNDAPVAVSYTIQDFKSVIEGQVAPSAVVNKGITLQPGQHTFSGAVTPLEGIECNRVTGEMHFDVRYGVPGFEDFQLKGGMRFKITFDPDSCQIKDQQWSWITDLSR